MIDLDELRAAARDLADPSRMVARTVVGMLMVSTVRTPMRNTYETCIFRTDKNWSAVIDSYMASRDEAFSIHQSTVEHVFKYGFTFEEQFEAVDVWIRELHPEPEPDDHWDRPQLKP